MGDAGGEVDGDAPERGEDLHVDHVHQEMVEGRMELELQKNIFLVSFQGSLMICQTSHRLPYLPTLVVK